MGVRKKYKRKMIRSNRLFYWYVEPDIDDEGIIKLHKSFDYLHELCFY